MNKDLEEEGELALQELQGPEVVHIWSVEGTASGEWSWDELRELKAAVGRMVEAPG